MPISSKSIFRPTGILKGLACVILSNQYMHTVGILNYSGRGVSFFSVPGSIVREVCHSGKVYYIDFQSSAWPGKKKNVNVFFLRSFRVV